MNNSSLSLSRITENTVIGTFDCGDEDLNEFLLSKATFYTKELLATTYLLEKDNETLAFFSIFNDNIRVEESSFASKSAFKKFMSQLVSHPKRHLEYFPAIKIGRLAVNQNIQSSGTGRQIINFIIDLAIDLNQKCACKFISVDAYKQSLVFYEKMGFKYFSNNDEQEDTRQMYLDLTPYLNTILEM
jgi:predicted GNAT family N-acyltransferase